MGKRKTMVVTAYGHSKTIDKIAVNSFDVLKNSNYNDKSSNAETYCNTINLLELKGDSWIRAKIITENTHYALDTFLPLNFSDIIMKLDNFAVQKVLREVDSCELAQSLKDQDETVKEKIFANMSKRAAKMLKEDLEDMGPVRINVVNETQEKILSIIQYMGEVGEIIIPY
ncbi:MAG: hypothetical protein LBH43_16945 [Treponema sp.]|jgi:flagellar motor switch protein FliG|nr:hypothetical protein [Treponema sp.]